MGYLNLVIFGQGVAQAPIHGFVRRPMSCVRCPAFDVQIFDLVSNETFADVSPTTVNDSTLLQCTVTTVQLYAKQGCILE